jgi:GT2 family glycosyltransferase
MHETIPNGKVGIVVLNYKNYEDTLECLKSLAELSYSDIEIIVVDNASGNNSLEHIGGFLREEGICHARIPETAIDVCAGLEERTILVQSTANRGYAAGNNIGIRVALARDAEFVLILNNDTLVERGSIEPLVEYAVAHEDVGAVGPKVVNCEGEIDRTCARRRPSALFYFFGVGVGRRLVPNNRWVRRHTYADEYAFNKARVVDVLSGCCVLIKRSVLQDVGLLDERTFLYLEEFILHERLRKVSLQSAVVPTSVIVHKRGRSTAALTPDFTRKVTRESLRHYLATYRCRSRFTAALLMALTWSPSEFLRHQIYILSKRARKAPKSQGG